MKRAFAIVVGLVLLLFLSSFFMLSGLLIVFEVPWYLGMGWAHFLSRVVPNVRVDPGSIVAALLVAAGLFAGLHAALSRLSRHLRQDDPSAKPWKLRWTASFFGLVVAMLVCSMASIGAVHHIGWLREFKQNPAFKAVSG